MQRKTALAVALILVTSLLTGCLGGSVGGRNTGSYSVQGVIIDYLDNEPVEGVVVVADNGITSITDEKGEFLFTSLKGKVVLTPRLDGWKFIPDSVPVSGPQDDIRFLAHREDEATSGGVKVSFVGSYGMKPAIHQRSHHRFTPEIYRDEFQDPGQIEGIFTPHKFVVNLQRIAVAHPNYRMPLLIAPGIATGRYSGFEIPIHFDLASNREVIDASYILEYQRFDFEAVEVLFFTHDEAQYFDDAIPLRSEIHVDLGEKYRGVVLEHEIAEKAYDTTHVFQLAHLIPLQNPDDARLAQLVFASYVDEPFILNPDGSYLHDYDVHEWDMGGNVGQAGYAIYLPGFELEFTEGIVNHLIFSWDLVGLIEVYDNNTPDDLSDDLVTLRLDNPFPIELYLETEHTYVEPPIEERPAAEVTHEGIDFFDLMEREVAIAWVNPNDPQYVTTHIVRKVGSAPHDVNDGELVYSGAFPLFKDSDVELDQHYFYRIFTESRSGLFSEGIVVDIVTSVPRLVDIEFWKLEKYSGSPVVEIELEVGEEVLLHVRGISEDGKLDIVVDWSVDEEEYGTLEFPRGETNRFKAEKPGETEIIAQHYSGVTKRLRVKIEAGDTEMESDEEIKAAINRLTMTLITQKSGMLN